MKELTCTVKSNAQIACGIFEMTVTLSDDVKVKCGQFLNISTGNAANLLKRPFGIMRINGRDVTFCYQLKGEGTKTLSLAKPGQVLEVTLPLGNGFSIPESARKIAVVLLFDFWKISKRQANRSPSSPMTAALVKRQTPFRHSSPTTKIFRPTS